MTKTNPLTAKSRIINTGERKFLVIELDDRGIGVPIFSGDYDEGEERP